MRRVVKQRIHHRLVVTTKTGDAFDGVLWEEDRQAWVLRNVTASGPSTGGAPVPVDGEVVVMTADIAYAQRP